MEGGVELGGGWSLVKQLRCHHKYVGGQTNSNKSDNSDGEF